MKIEVSNGEVVDKYTILVLKYRYSEDLETKSQNIKKELDYLEPLVEELQIPSGVLQKLQEVNEQLWHVEDQLRVLESQKSFEQEFVDCARRVYYLNDERARIKFLINRVTDSKFIEEKILPNYRN